MLKAGEGDCIIQGLRWKTHVGILRGRETGNPPDMSRMCQRCSKRSWKKEARCRNVQRLELTVKGRLCVNNRPRGRARIFPACVRSGFDLRTMLSIAAGSSPRDGDLPLVTAWPAFPQATLCVRVCGMWTGISDWIMLNK